jgi:hypothetical protein
MSFDWIRITLPDSPCPKKPSIFFFGSPVERKIPFSTILGSALSDPQV